MPFFREKYLPFTILLENPVIRRIFLIGIAVRVLLLQDALDPDVDREGVDMMQTEK